jgi:excisionase family DNA binding protein
MNALSSPHDNGGQVLDNHMSIQAAAEYSGYNLQYLRRIVRKGEVEGVKVGQVWLVNLASLDAYLKRVQNTDDRRYGPRVYQAYISSQSAQ